MPFSLGNGYVTIDNDFARFGGKSYAINKITSVEVRPIRQSGSAGGTVLIVFSVILTLSGLVELLNGGNLGGVFFVGTGLAMGFAGWNILQAAKREMYHLYLMTSSAETQAFETEDADEIMELRNVIENAMTGRPV